MKVRIVAHLADKHSSARCVTAHPTYASSERLHTDISHSHLALPDHGDTPCIGARCRCLAKTRKVPTSRRQGFWRGSAPKVDAGCVTHTGKVCAVQRAQLALSR